MPKRTNQFQHIVTYVAEQLAPFGATVKESIELPETGLNGVSREVDTLIELDGGVRIAVETRDRSRKDSLEWIDCLIGKYANLPVDLVVAVSGAGFSETAKQKAALHRIELLSPEEVTATDWPSKFQRLGIASVAGRLDLAHVLFHTTAPSEGDVSVEDRIQHGDTVGTVREFVEDVRPIVVAGVLKRISEKFLAIYRTLPDLDKTAIADWQVPVHDLYLLKGATRHVIDKLTFRVVAHSRGTIVPVKHRLLGDDALLSSGQVGDLTFVIAQVDGAPHCKVFLERETQQGGPDPAHDRTEA